FQSFWSQGIPVVVSKCLNKITLTDVGKEFFIRCYGFHRVRLVDCCGEKQDKKVSLAEFLSDFGRPRSPNDTIWKLKDWPPSEDLQTVLGELHDQMELTVPVPDMTRADGVHNFPSYFATNANKADLGPKMYLAYASQRVGKHIGSTFLHKDVTSAYNIALDVAESPTGEPGHALWHLWPSWASPMLEEFMVEQKLVSPNDGNPIHTQSVYLTESQIEAFSTRYEVKPFVIRQRKGDAVFIPPGCPHQVMPKTICSPSPAHFSL
ncbi:uncharacterized protein STEHIDRAFT_69030, partial [Stereum hirsutum FP-91666 SS1]